MQSFPVVVCTYQSDVSTSENPQEAQHRTAVEWLAKQQIGNAELVVVMPTRKNLNKYHHRTLTDLVSMSDVRYETKRTLEVYSCQDCAILLVWPDKDTLKEFIEADIRLSALAVIEGTQSVAAVWTDSMKYQSIHAL